MKYQSTAVGTIDVWRNSICLQAQSEWSSRTEEAWMGFEFVQNSSCVKTGSNLQLPIPGVVLYWIIVHWSLSIAERQAWLQRAPKQELFAFQRKKFPISYLNQPLQIKPRSLSEDRAAGNLYIKSVKYSFRRCSENFAEDWERSVTFWAYPRCDSLYKQNFNSNELPCRPAPQSCTDPRAQHNVRTLRYLETQFPSPWLSDSPPVLPSFHIYRTLGRTFMSPCRMAYATTDIPLTFNWLHLVVWCRT